MLVARHLKQRLQNWRRPGAVQRDRRRASGQPGWPRADSDGYPAAATNCSGQNFNRNFLDLSTQIGDALESQLSDDPAQKPAVDSPPVARIAQRTSAGHTAALATPDPANTGLRCRYGAGPALRLRSRRPPVHHAASLVAGRTVGAPPGAQASLLATDSGGLSFDECFTLLWWQLQ